jgi:hypothetical protein
MLFPSIPQFQQAFNYMLYLRGLYAANNADEILWPGIKAKVGAFLATVKLLVGQLAPLRLEGVEIKFRPVYRFFGHGAYPILIQARSRQGRDLCELGARELQL